MAAGKSSKRPHSPKDLFGDEEDSPSDRRAITLTVESGTHAGKRVTLSAGGAIGRSSKCELCLRGAPGVSRRHAQIYKRGSVFVASDTESRNGVILNGVEISGETPLSEGDLIELSDEQIRVSFGSDDLAASPTERIDGQTTARESDDLDTRPPSPHGSPSPTSPSPKSPPPRSPAPKPVAGMGLDSAVALLADLEEPIALEPVRTSAPQDPANRPPRPIVPPAAAPMSVPYQPAPRDAPAPPPNLPLDALEPIVTAPSLAPINSEVLAPTNSEVEPLGLPQEASPGDSAFPTAAAPNVSQLQPVPKRRGSILMFMVGSVVGLSMVLLAVGGGDALLNAGRLRASLFVKLNAHLAPHDIKIPTFAEVGAALGFDDEVMLADGGGLPLTGDDAGTAATAAGTDAGDLLPPKELPASSPQAPLLIRASTRLIVVKIAVKPGATVAAGDTLFGVLQGNTKALKARLRLEGEIRKFEKQAKRRGRKGRKAKKKLRAARREMTALFKVLKPDKIVADVAGKVTEVLARSSRLYPAKTPLLRLQPAAKL